MMEAVNSELSITWMSWDEIVLTNDVARHEMGYDFSHPHYLTNKCEYSL